MVDEDFFPELDLSEVDEIELTESIDSATKWTYVIDYRNRRAAFTDDGRPRKTKSYEEYLVQTAMKILNTERFQYVVYGEDIGVEKSEWPSWEDAEIKRDIEEALTAHIEIEQAEVLSMQRVGRDMHLQISLTGLVGIALLEEEITL
ncbi:DUF2634 domain-containing protein [Paenibacillus sp. IHBB 10380]|uniref:DUF2634 domain-containing protein n=1 Tax=Paenibacillus sp. IHBB 10380 TaxID=1566358 RepID=UPI0005D9A70D|nr:DUF2634 domain-containing protein [Paenibacillus sp. IHBB 10380]AJS59197.1 phage portal protein [Paenibacillus sp. IHBB 10380]